MIKKESTVSRVTFYPRIVHQLIQKDLRSAMHNGVSYFIESTTAAIFICIMSAN